MKNYAQWKCRHYTWDSVEQFDKAEEIPDGVHSLSLDSKTEIDLYVRNSPFAPSDRSVLIFFAGAVSGRESKTGPFFSGLGIAGKLNMPVIAFADPGVDNHPEVNLAWYTGGPGQGVQAGIAQILQSISRRSSRELLLAGGSGGGFAVLGYAKELGVRCSAFVWNAQTDILSYSERIVKIYFNKLFNYPQGSLTGADWKYVTRTRANAHVSTEVLSPETASRPARLFYLQNATDWHVKEHFEPFAKVSGFRSHERGVYAIDSNHVALIAHAASGHLPPPVALLTEVIEMMSIPSTSTMTVAERILGLSPIAESDFSTIPNLNL